MAQADGQRPRLRKFDLRTQVRKIENVNEPTVEYRFSNSRVFKRRVKDSPLYQ